MSSGTHLILQGSSNYVNLEMEVRRARSRTCSTCGLAGASLTCSHHR